MTTHEIKRALEQGAYILRLESETGIEHCTLREIDKRGNISTGEVTHEQWSELANDGFIVLGDKYNHCGYSVEKWLYWEETYRG